MGEIRLVKILVLQKRDEHGRNAVDAGDALLMDAGQRRFRRKVRKRHHGGSVRHGRRHGQHHAEAVEHGYLDQHPVGGGQVHSIADALPVVDDVVMGEHDPFGKTCGSRCILHVAHIVLVHQGCPPVHFFPGNAAPCRQGFFPSITSPLRRCHCNNITKKGQSFAV